MCSPFIDSQNFPQVEEIAVNGRNKKKRKVTLLLSKNLAEDKKKDLGSFYRIYVEENKVKNEMSEHWEIVLAFSLCKIIRWKFSNVEFRVHTTNKNFT